jgi:site-specific DNA recombinase
VIAAIYARKSTDQSGVSDEQRSVRRQVEHARAYAARKGWRVLDAHEYVDDGISGAEFATRPGFVRLMNALKPRPPFHALIMSEESRLGREAIETAYALKQLVQAGVRVFFYLEDRERTLDSPTDKIMLSLTAFADELEREKARQRTYDAMQRKARAGHVTGGRVFGYDNIEILDASGKRSHVARRINVPEAAVVRRIFEMCAAGSGLTAITKTLNAEGVPTPRPQRGRPVAWAANSIRAVLNRPLYRGAPVWNQTRKRDTWGQKRYAERPESEWVRVEAPDLQIVAADLWEAAHAQAAERRSKHKGGDRSHRFSPYLLSGFARCALCGGGFASQTREHGKHRARFYGCTSYWERGPRICPNRLVGRMEAIDAEVLDTLKDDILRPSVIERAIAVALAELAPERDQAHKAQLAAELAAIDAECRELTTAISAGGPFDVLAGRFDRLRGLQERRKALQARSTTRPPIVAPTGTDGLEARLRETLADWRGLLTRDVESGRDVLRTLLLEPLRFTPVEESGRRGYRFTGAVALDHIIGGVITDAGWPRNPIHADTIPTDSLKHAIGAITTEENAGWRSVPDGIRTRVSALKGPRPGPLDDGDS